MSAQTSSIAIGQLPLVNLMPPSETARRASAVLLRRWVLAILAAVLLVAAVAAGGFVLQLSAAQRLAFENLRTETLLAQMSELSDVQAQLDLQSELTTYRADAMTASLRWSGLLEALRQVVPAGVAVTGFSLSPGGMPQGDDPAAEIGAGGTITLTSSGPQQVVPLVRAARELPGVLEVDGWEVDATETGFTYELRIAFDQSVYTHAYDVAEEEE